MRKFRKRSCGSGHCCGSGNRERAPAGADTTAVVGTKQEVLLRERSLLGQWGNIEKDPAGAGTTAVVGNIEKVPA